MSKSGFVQCVRVPVAYFFILSASFSSYQFPIFTSLTSIALFPLSFFSIRQLCFTLNLFWISMSHTVVNRSKSDKSISTLFRQYVITSVNYQNTVFAGVFGCMNIRISTENYKLCYFRKQIQFLLIFFNCCYYAVIILIIINNIKSFNQSRIEYSKK